MTTAVLSTSVPLAGLALVVMLLGMRVRERIPAQTYRRWLRRLLAALAVILVAQSVGLG